MYNPYDDDSYSDYDDYDDSHDYDYSQPDWKKFYFSFDTGSGGAFSDWIKNIMDGLFKDDTFKNTPSLPSGFSPVSFPVNDSFSQYTAGGGNSLLYLGNNHYNEQVWKTKYFIHDKLGTDYVLHLQSHARHFVNQPRYYKALYEILN